MSGAAGCAAFIAVIRINSGNYSNVLCVFDLGETYFFRNEEQYPSIKTPFEAIKLRELVRQQSR